MEIYTSGTSKIKLSWWQIKQMQKQMKKSYILGESIKKISEYIKKWEEKKAEKLLENKLENI